MFPVLVPTAMIAQIRTRIITDTKIITAHRGMDWKPSTMALALEEREKIIIKQSF